MVYLLPELELPEAVYALPELEFPAVVYVLPELVLPAVYVLLALELPSVYLRAFCPALEGWV